MQYATASSVFAASRGPSIGCKKKCLKPQPLKLHWDRTHLRINQLQLVSAALHQSCASLGAHANPVQSRRRRNRSIGFHRNLKSARMQRLNQGRIHLQQRLAARANHKPLASAPSSGHLCATAAASASAESNFPPPAPSTPTNSVSQNRHTAVARSASRPDHKLHPANRQNTAARPACAPSPCSV